MSDSDSKCTLTLKLKDNKVHKIECQKGENLRKVLMRKAPWFIYHKPMNLIHCRGLGTCGTCAVEISGKTNDVSSIEKWRLNFPPHKNSIGKGLRLACQVEVQEDLELSKWDGLWGQGK